MVLQKYPKYLMVFGSILKTINFDVKTALATFWETFGKIGLLFILTLGHIDIGGTFSGANDWAFRVASRAKVEVERDWGEETKLIFLQISTADELTDVADDRSLALVVVVNLSPDDFAVVDVNTAVDASAILVDSNCLLKVLLSKL